jgi:hypothetical protein
VRVCSHTCFRLGCSTTALHQQPVLALHALAGLPQWTGMRADGSVSADRVALGAKKVLGDCSRILIFDNSGRVLYSSFPVRPRLRACQL